MRYQVGRACAVGGYVDLYRELDLLPDISIAEEAWDNLDVVGSKEIFDLIICQPTYYAVMDVYTRSVNSKAPRTATGLNGDTAVLSSLNVTIDVWEKWSKARWHYFNITEDYSVGETSSPQMHNPPLAPMHVPLLYNPLPIHLPTTKKDPLILHAAYEANIDRYARLRRPFMISYEEEAVTRGCYHNTSFARWCHNTSFARFYNAETKSFWGKSLDIPKAALARFIMVNDLSRIVSTTNSTDDWDFMPFMIWWPLIPQEATLRELARRRPDMRLQVAMACIFADYKGLWNQLTPEPHPLLWHQATLHPSCYSGPNQNYYVEDLERRAAEKNINLHTYSVKWNDKLESTRRDKEPTTKALVPNIQVGDVINDDLVEYTDGNVYGGRIQANVAEWELCIAVRDDVREQSRIEGYENENYGWPSSSWKVHLSI